jgi:hypothetical protein
MSPGSVNADGAVESRALAAPSASDTNASFRKKSQSFLHGVRNQKRKLPEKDGNPTSAALPIRRRLLNSGQKRCGQRQMRRIFLENSSQDSMINHKETAARTDKREMRMI